VERYLRMGIPTGKVDNFPFVVDPEHFGTAITLRASRTHDLDARFVTPARLIDGLKGHGVALDALRRVRALAPGKRVELVLAGLGADEARLRRRSQELGLTGAVRFAGWVEYPDVPALLGRADALVLPSWWDPYPVAVLEAMAAGLPVLGSDACGSVRERVVDGENGFVHSSGDAAALAQHMLTMIVSPETCLRMGRAALRTSRTCGIDHSVRVLRDVLTRVPQAAKSVAKTSSADS